MRRYSNAPKEVKAFFVAVVTDGGEDSINAAANSKVTGTDLPGWLHGSYAEPRLTRRRRECHIIISREIGIQIIRADVPLPPLFIRFSSGLLLTISLLAASQVFH